MPATPRHLFRCWSQVAGRLRSAPSIALFLDFDGTLTPLERRPEQVRLGTAMRRAISALERHSRVRVFILSGRKREDVRQRVRVGGVRYLGLHGWEGRGASALKEETRRMLEELSARASKLVEKVQGAWLEDKGAVLALHYIDAEPAAAGGLREAALRAVRDYDGHFRTLVGERSLEIAPAEAGDKGAAARRECAALNHAVLPVFVGDDAVDEPAFAALRQGITVRVGPPAETQARYRLAGIGEVQVFLERLRGVLR
jgi:trehalose 6-phosphate phosphatase